MVYKNRKRSLLKAGEMLMCLCCPRVHRKDHNLSSRELKTPLLTVEFGTTNDLSGLQNTMNAYADEVRNLSSKVQSLNTKSDDLTLKVQSLNVKSEDLESQLQSLNDDLNSQVRSLNARNVVLTSKCEILKINQHTLSNMVQYVNDGTSSADSSEIEPQQI